MSESGWRQVHAKVRDLMEGGYHCSEAFLLCVGEHVLGKMQPSQLRAATGFAGGFGCTFQGACGALTGGVMVLGLMYGRSSPAEDDGQCLRLVARYWEVFRQAFGTTECQLLRTNGYGSGGTKPCYELVIDSIDVFRNILPGTDEPSVSTGVETTRK